MKHAEPRLFEEEKIERKLSELVDPLEKLSTINWGIFREIIENTLERKDLSKGGRPPCEEHSAIQNTDFATVLQSL